MEKRRDMRKHVTFVAALHIGFGILSLIGALIVYFVFGFARSQVGSDEVAMMVLGILKMFIPILVGGFGLLGIVGGIGLMGYKPWARVLVIVLSALSCLNVPIGTAKGVYSLWALLQDDTMDLFQAGSKAGVASEEVVNSSSGE